MKLDVLNNKTVGTEVKVNNRHVSFKECFRDGWRDYFRKEDVLLKVIEAAGLTSTHDFVQVNSRYLIDDHRVAIILLLRRKGTEILDKVIVDVTSSHPRFEQLTDVFYNIGSDCDYRIILYDSNGNCEDLEGPCITAYSRLTSLMEFLEGCAFVAVMGIDLEVSESNDVSFQCVDAEMNNNDCKGAGLPARSDLEEAHFWGQYFYPAHRSYGIVCYEYSFGGGGYEEDGSDYISSSAYWGEDGMEFTYTFNEDDFTWLFTNKIEEMEELFKGCSISHHTEENSRSLKNIHSVRDILNAVPDKKKQYSSPEHSVTICRPIPFRNFIYSLHSDREDLAEEFARYATLSLYLDELLGEREDEDITNISLTLAENTSPR